MGHSLQGPARLCATASLSKSAGTFALCACQAGCAQNDCAPGRQHCAHSLAHRRRLGAASALHVLEIQALGMEEDDVERGRLDRWLLCDEGGLRWTHL